MANNQEKVRIPDEVKEFAKASFKKFKKRNKDYYDSKKELKNAYYSSLTFDLQVVIEFILKKGHIQNESIQDYKNRCFKQIAGEDGPKFVKFLIKYISKNGMDEIENIEFLPIILYEIIGSIHKYNETQKAENGPEAPVFDSTDLIELTQLILKKRLKKADKKGIPSDIALDILCIIPTSDAMKFSPYFRVKSVFEILYKHAEHKEVKFDTIMNFLLEDKFYDYVIGFALQERKEKIKTFNDTQKALFNDINEWVFNNLEDSDKTTIESIIKTYIKTRKRDDLAGKDSNRRYFISSLPETAYPRICKVVNKLIAEDEDAKKYL